jgi:hypothetical protein
MAGELAVQRMGSIQKVKASLKRGGGMGLIQGIPTDGITVRFLTEPDEWLGYFEYFDSDSNAFVPMVMGEQLPKKQRASHRYLANAVVVSDGPMQDKVVALKMAKTLAVSMMAKYDKYDTLLDRDYEMDRIGEGLDTTYDVTPDPPSKRNLKKYDLHDLEDVLLKARAGALGEEVDEDELEADGDEEAAGAAKPTRKRAPRTRATAEEVEEEEEEEADLDEQMAVDFDLTTMIEEADNGDEDAIAAMYEWFENEDTEVDPDDHATWQGAYDALTAERNRTARRSKKLPAADEDEDEEEAEEEDEEEDEAEDEEGIEVDEETLTEMSVSELRSLADEYGIEHKGLSKTRLVKTILDAAEE